MIVKLTAGRAPLLVVIVLGSLLAVVFLLWRTVTREPDGGTAPTVYLLSVDRTSRVRSGWRTQPLENVLALQAGQVAKVPKGSAVRALYIADGRSEAINAPGEISAPTNPMPDEPDFLRSPLREVVGLTLPPASVTAGSIRVRTPAGVTRFTKPMIDWVAKKDVQYDLALLDPGDPAAPPRVAQNVRPPLSVAALETTMRRELNRDRLYELIVREAGSTTVFGGARFLTSAQADGGVLPETPTELLGEALAAMAKKPTRTGDAWLALAKLPAGWRETELAVRLRLFVAAELGLAEEFAEAKASAERMLAR
jgi:hypothetical protein